MGNREMTFKEWLKENEVQQGIISIDNINITTFKGIHDVADLRILKFGNMDPEYVCPLNELSELNFSQGLFIALNNDPIIDGFKLVPNLKNTVAIMFKRLSNVAIDKLVTTIRDIWNETPNSRVSVILPVLTESVKKLQDELKMATFPGETSYFRVDVPGVFQFHQRGVNVSVQNYTNGNLLDGETDLSDLTGTKSNRFKFKAFRSLRGSLVNLASSFPEKISIVNGRSDNGSMLFLEDDSWKLCNRVETNTLSLLIPVKHYSASFSWKPIDGRLLAVAKNRLELDGFADTKWTTFNAIQPSIKHISITRSESEDSLDISKFNNLETLKLKDCTFGGILPASVSEIALYNFRIDEKLGFHMADRKNTINEIVVSMGNTYSYESEVSAVKVLKEIKRNIIEFDLDVTFVNTDTFSNCQPVDKLIGEIKELCL